MTAPHDVIVVGSGPSAVSAAWPLVEAGARVLMLDVGNEDTRYAPLIPAAPFPEIRRTARNQHRYFLGDAYEAIPLGRVRVGAQLTAPRSHITRDAETLTPIDSASFFPTESLALGGLGSGWGASAIRFDERDMEGFPIAPADLAPHYEAVARRIGISGARDDLLPYYGECASLQPPLDMDVNAAGILSKYERRRERLNRTGFYMGRPRLAVLTRDLDGRRAQRYHDMDFYADADRSVYRPWYTVEAMRKADNFTYARPWLVESFREKASAGIVEVTARDPRSGGRETFTGRRLVLAAGAMGTARIVLRSLGLYDTAVPIVCNPHIYIPCVNVAMLGKAASPLRHSLTQVGIVYDPGPEGPHLVYSEIHVYGSLLLFKLVKESFLPVPQAARIMRDLMSSFAILVIEHDDEPSPEKFCLLRRGEPGSPDVLHVSYRQDEESERRQHRAEKRLSAHMRQLGCWPVGRIDPGHGASIHYGGTFPMSAQESRLSVTPSCRLREARGVYLVDGSVLPRLPAKPLTFTLMANADRVARAVLDDLA